MAYYYGSDWEEKANREQVFLDNYVRQKSQRDQEDRMRADAERMYKEEERADRARKRQMENTTQVFDLVEKVKRGGGDATQLDPAIFQGIPIPPQAIFSSVDKKIGMDEEALRQKQEKAALDLEALRTTIDMHKSTIRRNDRPEKGPAEEKPMTRASALTQARILLSQSQPLDPTTLAKKPLDMADIKSTALDFLGATPFGEDAGDTTPEERSKSRGPKEVGAIDPAATPGKVNPAAAADKKQKAATLTPEQMASVHVNPKTGERIYWNGQGWAPVP